MKLLLLTFGFGVVSAIIPIFNMEAYISVVYASTDQPARPCCSPSSARWARTSASWSGTTPRRGALDIPWLKQQMDTPKRQAQFERWSDYVQGRPLMSGLLTFVSAAIGFPPFFAMAMVAGTLRMNVVVFFVAGLLGRTLFFWAWLLGVGLIFH